MAHAVFLAGGEATASGRAGAAPDLHRRLGGAPRAARARARARSSTCFSRTGCSMPSPPSCSPGVSSSSSSAGRRLQRSPPARLRARPRGSATSRPGTWRWNGFLLPPPRALARRPTAGRGSTPVTVSAAWRWWRARAGDAGPGGAGRRRQVRRRGKPPAFAEQRAESGGFWMATTERCPRTPSCASGWRRCNRWCTRGRSARALDPAGLPGPYPGMTAPGSTQRRAADLSSHRHPGRHRDPSNTVI